MQLEKVGEEGKYTLLSHVQLMLLLSCYWAKHLIMNGSNWVALWICRDGSVNVLYLTSKNIFTSLLFYSFSPPVQAHCIRTSAHKQWHTNTNIYDPPSPNLLVLLLKHVSLFFPVPIFPHPVWHHAILTRLVTLISVPRAAEETERHSDWQR